jgi:hypothetical protein
MRKHLLVIAMGLGGGLVLAGCHDDGGTTVPTPPTVTPSVAFETFVQTQTEQNTCESTVPAQTNNVDFTFASDQDDADPRDISAVTAACTASAG